LISPHDLDIHNLNGTILVVSFTVMTIAKASLKSDTNRRKNKIGSTRDVEAFSTGVRASNADFKLHGPHICNSLQGRTKCQS
jgi:hypothetical protein